MQGLRPRATLPVAILTLTTLLCGAAPTLAATVTVRIEGENQTLLERTTVTTSPDPVPGNGCPGHSAAGAIEVATNGNWDRKQFVQTILGETHKFDNSDYWAEWLNNRYGSGICDDILEDGDELVMLVDFSPNVEPTVYPVVIEGTPQQVRQGVPFTVTVVEYVPDGFTPGTGERTPVAGATVGGGGATAITDANGQAVLTMPTTGNFTLKAHKSTRARSAAEPVCVHSGDAASCSPSPVGFGNGGGGGGAAADVRPPAARILGIRDGQRFAWNRAPRLLRGATDPGAAGVYAVRMRLRRQVGRRCWYYSARVERLRKGSCRAGHFFYTISDRAEWSYLLAVRPPAGRYVLAVTVMDRWGRVVADDVRFSVARRPRR